MDSGKVHTQVPGKCPWVPVIRKTCNSLCLLSSPIRSKHTSWYTSSLHPIRGKWASHPHTHLWSSRADPGPTTIIQKDIPRQMNWCGRISKTNPCSSRFWSWSSITATGTLAKTCREWENRSPLGRRICTVWQELWAQPGSWEVCPT